ncbi:MAG: phosphinothricin acetyltransferase [Alphaproteobacteria bacterium]|jgi:phosphinothricin acetyltransferase
MENSQQDIAIRTLQDSDRAAVLRIYQEGIDTGHATFQALAPSWDEWGQGHLNEGRLVAERLGRVVGWVAMARISSRPVYAGVVEHSIYIADEGRGLGVGRRLMLAFIETIETQGFWTLQAGIFPENRASITLHQNVGFKIVGVRRRIGQMGFGPLKGVWRDVVLLERRSDTVGVD